MRLAKANWLTILAVQASVIGVAHATDPATYNTCAAYICAQSNVVASAPGDFALQISGSVTNWAYWKVPAVPKPTLAQLNAVKTNALAWKVAADSDMDAKLDKLVKAFALVVLDEINTVRSNLTSTTNLPTRTTAQLKAAVAAKYQTLP